MIRFDDAHRIMSLAVRDLVEAGAPQGNPWVVRSAQARLAAGRSLHQSWRDQREEQDPAWRGEVSVDRDFQVRGWTCRISGRADGVSREGNRTVVEEVKSCALDCNALERLTLSDLGAWSWQLLIYLHLLAEGSEAHSEESPFEQAVGRLVLVSQVDGWRRIVHVPDDPGTGTRLLAQLDFLVREREALLVHRQVLGASRVPFAHDSPRSGQAEMAREVRDVLLHGGRLLLQAPTGVGKTAAVLQGSLEASITQDRRLFYATARNTQQRIVEETLRNMVREGLPLRTLTLRAKARACPHPEASCTPERCPLVADHGERVRNLGLLDRLSEHLGCGVVTAEIVDEVARQGAVCPHHLALDFVDRADVVVGDYNYVFDPFVFLRRHLGEKPGEWFLVVDEAHNLPERVREAWSPSLSGDLARQAAQDLYRRGPLFDPFTDLALAVERAISDGFEAVVALERKGRVEAELVDLVPERFKALRAQLDCIAPDYALLMGNFAHFGGAGDGDPYLALSEAVLRFTTILESVGEESVLLRLPGGGEEGPILKVLCRDPAPRMGARIAELAGGIFMSATLHPASTYRDLLGLKADSTQMLRVPSPFDPSRLLVVIAPQVSTRMAHRGRDRAETTRLVDEVVAAIPGNCAVLFPSFEFRDAILDGLRLSGRERLVQERQMDDAHRGRLMQRLREGLPGPPLVLLGVLGGIFAEGIDLPGDALLGVVVVGPPLPVVGVERELIRGYYEERWGDGFKLAYLVPGMARVVQAAGRVVRTETDHGAVVLIGKRFLQSDYAAFFPAEWEPRISMDPLSLLEAFFAGHDKDEVPSPDPGWSS